ncbi:2-phosphosulfolactate phosphatase [Alkalihalophilus marmarensis]|jgi:2-phosphosulfolactate phosphatase|uniref:2-phosphosulfolactate phosphatase n=1 Tax=Alkalihalophilus marmarensis TaxID=521377 RepID=UPI0020420460|nr:2-phosphosulfolactate phosphatase [Alkalihalophilus marmarensis]MCM3491613.1 2-phosphosulfolactate phosphatase [Alkalihalophilus marmarensis]
MRKIHVITQKELVDSHLIRGCTAVVIDVFLATSSITALIESQYSEVFAVKNASKALEQANMLQTPCLLMGEANGKSIDQFIYPDPTLIEHPVGKQSAVICSTNGTVAIQKAQFAKRLYASSLVNGDRVSEDIVLKEDDSSVVIICSGNAGRFSIEDFVGAGQLIDHLLTQGAFTLSDAATSARESYQQARAKHFINLLQTETADLLSQTGYEHTIHWVLSNIEKMRAVPIYQHGRFVAAR